MPSEAAPVQLPGWGSWSGEGSSSVVIRAFASMTAKDALGIETKPRRKDLSKEIEKQKERDSLLSQRADAKLKNGSHYFVLFCLTLVLIIAL
jgi:U3 small nucleolar RNA-associated protein 14